MTVVVPAAPVPFDAKIGSGAHAGHAGSCPCVSQTALVSVAGRRRAEDRRGSGHRPGKGPGRYVEPDRRALAWALTRTEWIATGNNRDVKPEFMLNTSRVSRTSAEG